MNVRATNVDQMTRMGGRDFDVPPAAGPLAWRPLRSGYLPRIDADAAARCCGCARGEAEGAGQSSRPVAAV